VSEQPILGRTSKKWQPFASIPQQFKGIAKIIDNQAKVPQPILEDDEKERINHILNEALQFKDEIALVYWNNGRINTEIGIINKIDPLNSTIQFIDKFNKNHSLLMNSLVEITKLDNRYSDY